MAYGSAMETMTGPPVPPPDMPTLSAYPASEGGVGPAQGGAIFRLFESVIRTLDTIASAAPQCAEHLDEVKTILSDVLVEIVNSGAQDKPARKSPGLMTPNREMESVG